MPVTYEHLTERIPNVSAEELLAGFRPSERFGEVSFDSYIPDPNQPSQAEAVQKLKTFGDKINKGGNSGGFFGKLFGGKKKDSAKSGLYLDGGFGVGKTHLLASLWHYVDGPKASVPSSNTPTWLVPSPSANRRSAQWIQARLH